MIHIWLDSLSAVFEALVSLNTTLKIHRTVTNFDIIIKVQIPSLCILQVKDQSMHIEGADVIQHMIDHFL